MLTPTHHTFPQHLDPPQDRLLRPKVHIYAAGSWVQVYFTVGIKIRHGSCEDSRTYLLRGVVRFLRALCYRYLSRWSGRAGYPLENNFLYKCIMSYTLCGSARSVQLLLHFCHRLQRLDRHTSDQYKPRLASLYPASYQYIRLFEEVARHINV
jgi:hypothetical protein